MMQDTLQSNKAHSVDVLPSPADLANISLSGGTVYSNDYSYTHMRNNKDSQTYILAREAPALQASRIAIAEATGIDLVDLGWTYSRIARQIGEWIGIKDLPAAPPRGLIERWHYQQVIPCTIDNCVMYDLKAAYFMLACRAPSLLCEIDLGRDRTTWLSMPVLAESRWETIKPILIPLKRLRLAVVGVSMTGYSTHDDARASYYCKGKLCRMASRAPTCFQSCALWTVRSAYEITQMQAKESRAFYANADCVASDCKRVSYWDDLGLPYAIKGKGTLDLNGVGNYRIGNVSTKPYQKFGAKSLTVTTPYLYDRPVYHLAIFQ